MHHPSSSPARAKEAKHERMVSYGRMACLAGVLWDFRECVVGMAPWEVTGAYRLGIRRSGFNHPLGMGDWMHAWVALWNTLASLLCACRFYQGVVAVHR